jgi:hypothetical protein
MSERENNPDKAAFSGAHDRCYRVARPVGGMRSHADMATSPRNSDPCHLGPFRLAGVAKQILVDKDLIKQTFQPTKAVKDMSNKTRHKKMKKTGRPASSSNVRLTPHFRNPVDIERLGKALAAIALKQSAPENRSGKEVSDAVEE